MSQRTQTQKTASGIYVYICHFCVGTIASMIVAPVKAEIKNHWRIKRTNTHGKKKIAFGTLVNLWPIQKREQVKSLLQTKYMGPFHFNSS